MSQPAAAGQETKGKGKATLEPVPVVEPEPPLPAEATIHQRMARILAELPAIGKNQENTQQKFMYRGYDDVLNALNPLMGEHGVYVVPDVLERVRAERATRGGSVMYEVNLRVRFRFYGLAGDHVEASGWGEGTDMGDKATSKAMTMALKYVLFQAFAISTEEAFDADADTAEETVRGQAAAAPSGPRSWPEIKAWVGDAYDAGTWEAFGAFAKDAAEILFGVREGGTPEQRQELGKAAAAAAVALREAVPAGGAAPPTREQMQAAWVGPLTPSAGAEGVPGLVAALKGPDWRMSPEEEDRPAREPAGDEAAQDAGAWGAHDSSADDIPFGEGGYQ